MGSEIDHTGSDVLDPHLLAFLEQPGAYPHRPKRVNHVQTHISHVFIVPPYVYKLKKPVDFGFLDYSTLDKRRHYCRRELELNRRLCADIYQDVIPIGRKGDTFVLDPVDELPAVEYAVKMKKLREERFLYNLIERESFSKRQLDRVADTLAAFYSRQDPGPDILEWGDVEKIRYNTDENFRQTDAFIGDTIEPLAYEVIQRYTNRWLDEKASLFKKRVEEKRILDGHGDLHLDHIHLTPDRVCIYDCIEFNDRFRYGDQASDIAYLAMDLDFKGHWNYDRYFVNRMSEKLDDPELPGIIDFYKCYRAFVKGKVKSLQSDEEEVGEEERARAAEKASAYFRLSLHYALLGTRPTVLILMGSVGSGKSTIAGELRDRLDIPCYRSDHIRKKLGGLPLTERTPKEKREELYTPGFSERTYRQLFKQMESETGRGRSVILDATFSSRSGRRRMFDKLDEQGVDYAVVETRAPDPVIKQRLEERDQKRDVVSDARLEDFEKLNRNYEPPDEVPPARLVQLRTDRPVNETVRELFGALFDRQLSKI